MALEAVRMCRYLASDGSGFVDGCCDSVMMIIFGIDQIKRNFRIRNQILDWNFERTAAAETEAKKCKQNFCHVRRKSVGRRPFADAVHYLFKYFKISTGKTHTT